MFKLNNASLSKLYIIVTLLIFSFIGVNVHPDFMGIVVPHIEMSQAVLHSVFLVMFMLLFCLVKMLHNHPVRLDLICGCLFLKCLFDAFPFINGTVSATAYLQFYMCTIVSFCTYFIMINTEFREKDIKKINCCFITFSLILVCEVVYTFLNNPVSYGQLGYKMNMVIPYGGSNVIASALVPVLCLVYLSNIKSSGKLCLIAFILVAIVLTCSKGGMLLSGVALSYLLFFGTDNKRYKTLNRAGIVLLTLFGIGCFVVSGKVLVAFDAIKSGNMVHTLSNGRIELWVNSFTELNEKLIFGIGMYPDKYSGNGLHNILLDLFLRCGFIGMVNYLIMFVVLIVRGRYIFKCKKTPYFIMICMAYINSLYELSYFYYNVDTVLWLYIGLMMSVYYTHKINNKTHAVVIVDTHKEESGVVNWDFRDTI